MLDIQSDGRCYMTFKRSLALQEPTGNLEQMEWALAGDGEDRVDEGIGFYEGAVQVYAKGAVVRRHGAFAAHHDVRTTILKPRGTHLRLLTVMFGTVQADSSTDSGLRTPEHCKL
jgi:hypothetical protein